MKINPFLMKLTEDQEHGFEVFSNWLGDKANLFAKLKGYAGAGKTTLTSAIIAYAKTISVEAIDPLTGATEIRPLNLCVSAPTNQAKKVIAKVTRVTARTIQSLLGLALNTDIENFDINNPDFSIKREPTISKYELVIIDEGSMINSSLLGLIKATAISHGVKVLIVYDNGQLPPVGEMGIPIEDDNDILISVMLDKVLRTSENNPILDTFTKIRSDLHAMNDVFQHTTRVSPDNTCGEVYIKNKEEFQLFVARKFWNAYQKNDITKFKVLAWSNKSVNVWNSLIRSSIRGALGLTDEHSKVFMKNEPLVSFAAIEGSIINPSEEYRLDEVERITEAVPYRERNEEGVPGDELFVDVKYFSGVLTVYDGSSTQKEKVKFVDPDIANIREFMKAFKWYHSLGAIDRRWKDGYFAWKDKNLLIRDIVNGKGKAICTKDFDYSYAVTIHKAQGTTYTNVYIDEVDIDQLESWNFNKYIYEQLLQKKKTKFAKAKVLKDFPNLERFFRYNQELKNRLKYVAMSRPTDFMVMFTNK